MELTNIQIMEFNNSIVEMLGIEGSKYEFADVVIDLKNIYEPLAKKIDEKGKEIQKRLDKAKIECCEKDPKNNNKPIITTLPNGNIRYQGLSRGQSEEFDKISDKLEKEAMLLRETIERIEDDKFEKIRKLRIEQCPKAAMKVRHWEVIRPYINE